MYYLSIIEKADIEKDSSSQLKKFEEALNFANKKKYERGIFQASKKIGEWKKSKYNSDSAIGALKNGLRLVGSSSQYIANFNGLIGTEFLIKADYDSAQYYYNEQIDFSIKHNINEQLALAYKQIGTMWHQRRQFDDSFKYYTKCDSVLSKDEKLKVSALRAQVYNYLGYCMRLTKGYDKAIEYYIKARDLHKKLQNELGVQEANIAIAQAYISFKEYDKALELLNQSIEYHKNNNTKVNAYTYGIVVRAYLYLNLKDYKKSEKDYMLYHKIKSENKDLHGEIKALGYLAYYYSETNQLNEAIKYYTQAIEKTENLKEPGNQIALIEELVQVYKKQKNYEAIVTYYDKIAILEKEIQTAKIAEETRKLETKYQSEKKEQQIALLKSEKELTEEKQKSQRNILIGGLGLTTVAGLFLFFLYKNRQKTNTKLKELDKVKSNFFANISHEFRTPLTLITHPIEKILQDESISKNSRDEFTMAKKNSDRLLSLVNQLLDLSKIDAGQLKLRIQKSNPIQIISAISESFNYTAQQKNISYSINTTHLNDQVWFDKDALEKITINLISNALKYTPEKGSVICDASIKDNHLNLEVKNTGKGLTQDEVKHIFQRFYQTCEDNQGTGIGLALVKELVELHKGTIEVKSIPNQLTTFKVILPTDKSSFKEEEFINFLNQEQNTYQFSNEVLNNDDLEFTENNQPILLIVEDNADVKHLLKDTFKDTYNIITASNGEEGISLALKHVPDIIVSDIMMPIKDGVALTEELKNNELTSHIPIILLTAKAGDENKLKGVETGADDYITKPFSSKILIAKVAKLIELRQNLQKRYSQEIILRPKDIAVTDLDEQFMEKVQFVLDEKLVEPSFSVEDFSNTVGMSRMQLHRKLKALTGLSASEFIRSQRLKLAAKLLKTSDINISQVGYSVGFNDHSYFTKCFKETYRCTPTEYVNRK